MKEKIFLALKAACGQTTSISDKTLDKIAETMAATVTEESQITAAIESQKPILQAIDGNINFVAAEAVKKVKPVEPKDPKPADPKPKPTDPNEPEWFKTWKEDQEKKINALTETLTKQEKEKKTGQLMTTLSAKLKEKGIPEFYYSKRTLALESEADIDTLSTTLEKEWATDKQQLAEQGVIISVPPSGAGSPEKGEQLGKDIAAKRNAQVTAGVEGKKI